MHQTGKSWKIKLHACSSSGLLPSVPCCPQNTGRQGTKAVHMQWYWSGYAVGSTLACNSMYSRQPDQSETKLTLERRGKP